MFQTKIQGEGGKKSVRNILKIGIVGYLVIFLIIGSFLGGLVVGEKIMVKKEIASVEGGKVLDQNEKLPDYLSKDVAFDLYWKVWNLVKDKYIDQPVVDTKLFYGSLAGIVAALGDPYSVYLDPETSQKFTEELSGSFEGIGAEIGIKNNRLTIIAPLPDTPAEKAGLKASDKIYGIDGLDTTGMALDYATNLIRGAKGTDVTLTIGRDGLDELKDYKITRDVIEIKSVSLTIKNNIATIKLSYFNGDTMADFEKVVQEILIKNPKGIILDLRNNPGGFLDTAVAVASEWVKDGTVVFEEFGNKEKTDYPAEGRTRLKDYKTIILTNAGSASASEIVAGALQDYKKATLVGEKTFGKGSVQEMETLDDGSAVKITVAHWLTPNGRSINEQGIAPDIEVKLTKEDYNANKDPQMAKALELLK
jgi:carboxyl-terminal processing protease